ncbi:hypothetical protein [Kineococcus sp. R86509]|uniref:hypothetical protein n=1 Tax=Kineococcus sp. R86509 TaxID=3093851 RepID=UPI0036D429CC
MATIPVLLLSVVLSASGNGGAQILGVLVQMIVGSLCCYAAARVLRPPSTESLERGLRHACAAAATAAACYVAAAVWVVRGTEWFQIDSAVFVLWWLLPLAQGLVLLSVVWGLIAVMVRLVRHPG